MGHLPLKSAKVMSAEEAANLIKSGSCLTVGGTVGWGYPSAVVRALEVRFLTTGEPSDLTLLDTFPTGVPGIEPLAHPGFLRRVIAGWYTPHPRLREMVLANEVEAYVFPLGTLSFLCQQVAAGRKGLLTQVGLDTYLDPRQTGGKLNSRTTEDLVSLVEVAGEQYLWYKAIPVSAAVIRGTVVDEAGNLSLEDEIATINVLYQALAAKANGGVVIAQAKHLVGEGAIHPRLVTVPGCLIDAVVIDPEQHTDEMNPDLDWVTPSRRMAVPPASVMAANNKQAWRQWSLERTIDGSAAAESQDNFLASAVAPVLDVRPLNPDTIIARRAALELQPGDFANIGAGSPQRDLGPVSIEEGLQEFCELSVEPGLLGGRNNGIGFRINTTAVIDAPAIFSLYNAGLPDRTYLSMLEFDREGNVNLLRYGDNIVGPGGSMDIAHAVDRIVVCGTFRAGGLSATGKEGRLVIEKDGSVPRAVERVEAICLNGRRMLAAGKTVTFITERAVFELTPAGVRLAEVAPGVDVERDIVARMGFAPLIDTPPKMMDARIFTPGPMGITRGWRR